MSIEVERQVYGGRGIRGTETDDGERVEGWPEVAYEAVRAMNHLTITPGPQGIPAPVVYDVLGNLSGMAHMLRQLCDQLDRGLRTSLDADGIEIYDNKGEPAESVAIASDALAVAQNAARKLGEALADAQVAINSQGYNPPPDAE